MKRQKLLLQRSTSRPGDPPSPWRGLQARLAVSYLGAMLGTALFFQATHSILSSSLQRPSLTWTKQVTIDAIVLLMDSLIGGLIGVTFTRRIIKPLRNLAPAPPRFPTGPYD